MNLGTWVSYELFIEAESLARKLGVSRSELLRRALIAYVGAELDQPAVKTVYSDEISEALDGVYSESDSRVDEVLARMQWASLPEESW